MMTEEAQRTIQTLNVHFERQIAAPIEIVFETVLKPQGPLADMALKLEAWPGGRWFRDLGNNTGHLWGHVQVIKPPKLLEITGPLMMSYPVASHIQYRLTEQGGGTLLQFTHQAFGLLDPQHMEGVKKGWNQTLDGILARAEKVAKGSKMA
jgi:uncharacterized protein YndB with AHSA1/START domain